MDRKELIPTLLVLLHITQTFIFLEPRTREALAAGNTGQPLFFVFHRLSTLFLFHWLSLRRGILQTSREEVLHQSEGGGGRRTKSDFCCLSAERKCAVAHVDTSATGVGVQCHCVRQALVAELHSTKVASPRWQNHGGLGAPPKVVGYLWYGEDLQSAWMDRSYGLWLISASNETSERVYFSPEARGGAQWVDLRRMCPQCKCPTSCKLKHQLFVPGCLRYLPLCPCRVLGVRLPLRSKGCILILKCRHCWKRRPLSSLMLLSNAFMLWPVMV